MDTLLAILKATHCKSTHHFFALDALLEVQTDRGLELSNLLLVYYQDYLTGAKDPDNVFKDFENHVLHVRDQEWGGAIRTSLRWYEKCLTFLQQAKWKEAAYAVGVLSHYFSDPFMPLHTGQSERETTVHRPLEWSVKCAYEEIYGMATEHDFPPFEWTDSPDWFAEGIRKGAQQANRHYETLIDQYNMAECSRQPTLALNRTSKRILAEIFTWVITGWAGVIDRLATETPVSIPEHSLTPATLIAGLQVPSQWVLKKIDSVQQRQQVAKIWEEFQTTGKVVRNLPAEQKAVLSLRNRDPQLQAFLAQRNAQLNEQAKSSSIATQENKDVEPVITQVNKPTMINEESLESIHSPTVPHIQEPVAISERTGNRHVPNVDNDASEESDAEEKPIGCVGEGQDIVAKPKHVESHASHASVAYEFRLKESDPIVDAPSIGPKTAVRFHQVGCETVGAFLSRDTEEWVERLETKWIDSKLISLWQVQARLMCELPEVNAVGAILMSLTPFDTIGRIAETDLETFYHSILEAAETHIGKRALRNQAPPSLERITPWWRFAQDHAKQGSSREVGSIDGER